MKRLAYLFTVVVLLAACATPTPDPTAAPEPTATPTPEPEPTEPLAEPPEVPTEPAAESEGGFATITAQNLDQLTPVTAMGRGLLLAIGVRSDGA
ncbi:MAG: hypothetical protein ACFB51_06930 [Anaerolineae bacterium]